MTDTEMIQDLRNTLRRISPLFLLSVGALVLRIALFVARGDYLTFDEGYYLILAKNLWSGRGYTLSGLPHTVFSPLYPVLVGGVNVAIDNLVWAGRIVSAVASAALILPVFVIARRLFGVRAAWLAAGIVTLSPALTAFVAYWSGRDLYQSGSELLFHLMLFSALAVYVRREGVARAALAGALLGIGFLARTEAVVIAALLGIAVAWPRRGIRPAIKRGMAFGVMFWIMAAPHVLYLRHVTGHWTLSGRLREAVLKTVSTAAKGKKVVQGGDTGAAELLWGGSELAHIRGTRSLDRTATRLATGYWGVQTPPTAAPLAAWDSLEAPSVAAKSFTESPPTKAELYRRTLAIVFPVGLWPIAILGMIRAIRKRRHGFALAITAVLGSSSLMIAKLVHVDPRNHLYLVPWLAIWAGAGLAWITYAVERRLPELRKSLVVGLAASMALGPMAVTAVHRFWLGLTVPSPHHVVGSLNRRVGREIAMHVAPDEPIMSWHPAIAIYANRDWRVLPYEPMPQVMRYAAANQIPFMVLSVFYPTPLNVDEVAHYVGFRLPASYDGYEPLTLDWISRGDTLSVGVLSIKH